MKVNEMDAAGNGTSSFTPIKPSASSKVLISDENDQSRQQTGMEFDPTDNPTRSMPHSSPSSNVDSESLRNVHNSLMDGSPKGPYDPLSNYLSPRPKFLRYKPNRRQEIFLRLQNEVGEGNFGSSSPKESYVKQEEEEVSEESEDEIEESDEEDFEELEEKRGWSFKGIFITSILFLGFLLSASYISSENSTSIPPLDLHYPEVFKDGFCSTQNSTTEAALSMLVQTGSSFYGQREEKEKFFLQMVMRNSKESSLVNESGSFYQEEEREVVLVEEEEKAEFENLGKVGFTDGMEEVAEVEAEDSEVTDIVNGQKYVAVEDFRNDEELKKNEVLQVEIYSEFEGLETKENQEKYGYFQDNIKPILFNGIDDLEKAENEETNLKEAAKVDCFERAKEINSEFEGLETKENQEKYGSFQDNKKPILFNGIDDLEKAENEETNLMEAAKVEMVEIITELEKINHDLEEEGSSNHGHELIELMNNESLIRVLIGFSTVITTFLVASLLFKKKRATKKQPVKCRSESPVIEHVNTTRRRSSLIEKLCIETAIVESYSSLPPSKWVDCIEQPSDLIKPMEEKRETSKELNSRQGPTIELLGEFVVGGGETSGSLRSSNMKSKESNNYSISPERSVNNKAHSGLIHSRTALSELSNSPSHGSFTAEKKIVKKEVEGRDGEMKVLMTPVRRSTRIKSRAVMSP